jgi:hypothetical protein
MRWRPEIVFGEFSEKATIIPLDHLALPVGLFVACASEGVVYKDVGKQLILTTGTTQKIIGANSARIGAT